MRVRDAVDAGEAKSQNEFVERAIRRELLTAHRRHLYDQYDEAASDQSFLAEMLDEDRAWDAASSDGLTDEEP